MNIGEQIKKLRKQKGLSQEQLAEQLIVSRAAVAKWESNNGVPDIENLKKLSEVFGVTIDELVKDEILIKTKSGKLSMSKEYQRIYTEIHSVKAIDWLGALKSCASKYSNEITRKTYMEFLPEWVSLDRVRYMLSKLESTEVLKREGSGKATKYTIIKIPDNINL